MHVMVLLLGKVLVGFAELTDIRANWFWSAARAFCAGLPCCSLATSALNLFTSSSCLLCFSFFSKTLLPLSSLTSVVNSVQFAYSSTFSKSLMTLGSHPLTCQIIEALATIPALNASCNALAAQTSCIQHSLLYKVVFIPTSASDRRCSINSLLYSTLVFSVTMIGGQLIFEFCVSTLNHISASDPVPR